MKLSQLFTFWSIGAIIQNIVNHGNSTPQYWANTCFDIRMESRRDISSNQQAYEANQT